jgi:tetratricopeptide (TPR) repeat protein
VLLPLLAAALFGAPAAAQQRSTDSDADVHDRCVAFVRSNPKEGLEKAKVWKEQGGGFYADHCVAMALFQLGDFAGAARRFQALATAMLGLPARQRGQALDQAGQSWLNAREPARAKAAFDAAIALVGEDPDLLIDRASASYDMQQYWDMIDDLNRAAEVAPKRADIYIYRGTAYRLVDSPDLALEDIERGLALAPNSPIGLLERGTLRQLKGDVAGARKDWTEVVKLAPTSTEGKAAKAKLAELGDKAGAKKAASEAKKKQP